MKTPLLQYGKWTLVAGGLILSTGCMEEFLAADALNPGPAATGEQAQVTPEDNSSSETNQKVGANGAKAPGPAGIQAPPQATSSAPVLEKTNALAAADVKVIQNPAPPTNIHLSPALFEIVKLVESGVAEDVIFAFITNSTNIFHIGPDEIVYLNDLGASSGLITALIQHDSSPETLARKQAAVAVQPLPPGVALSKPATNIYPSDTVFPPPTNTSPDEVESQASVPDATSPTVVPAETTYVAAASQPVSVSYFQTVLAPYGSWIDVPDYGLCWRPTAAVTDHSWRPYAHHGRWLWTDRGWYWYSHYSWGWAPFHYGRWCDYPRVGWIWVPDTVWAPSWVTWRYNNYYCGWAPLPPRCDYVTGFGLHYRSRSVGISFDFGLSDHCYTFIPTRYFCNPRPHHYFAHRNEVGRLYKESTVVNHYVVGNNNTIINQGIGYNRVAQVTRDEIRRLNVKAIPESHMAVATAPARVHGRPGWQDARASLDPAETRGETLDPDNSTLLIRQPRFPKLTGGSTEPASHTVRGEVKKSLSRGKVELDSVPAPRSSEGAVSGGRIAKSPTPPEHRESVTTSPNTAQRPATELSRSRLVAPVPAKRADNREPRSIVHVNRPKDAVASPSEISRLMPAPMQSVPGAKAVRPVGAQTARTGRPSAPGSTWTTAKTPSQPPKSPPSVTGPRPAAKLSLPAFRGEAMKSYSSSSPRPIAPSAPRSVTPSPRPSSSVSVPSASRSQINASPPSRPSVPAPTPAIRSQPAPSASSSVGNSSRPSRGSSGESARSTRPSLR